MHFWLVVLSTPSMPTLFERCTEGDDTIYLELRVVGWNKLARYWQLIDKKNSPLAINNYLLKHNGVTIIYIYVYICGNCIAFCCIWEADKWGIRLVRSFYITQFFGEWGFCWRGFSACRDFFSYSPVFVIVFRFFLLILKTSIFIENSLVTNIPNWLTNYRSFCILLLFDLTF